MSVLAPQAITLIRGDDYSGEDSIVIDASDADGLDLTAYETVTFTAATPSGEVVWSVEATDATADAAYVDIPYALWDDWEVAGSPARMAWDVQCSDPPRTVARGTIVVEQEVTK